MDWDVRGLEKTLFWEFVGNLREESGEMVADVRWLKTEEMVVGLVVGAEAAILEMIGQ